MAKNPERAKALQDSYAATTAWLIEKHRPEFDEHRAVLLKAAGHDWSPKLTAEQKDEAALSELLTRNPHLLDRVLAQASAAQAAPAADADPS